VTAKIEQLQGEKDQLAKDYDRLKTLLNMRNRSLFGRSSEKLPTSASEQKTNDHDSTNDSASALDRKRSARIEVRENKNIL